MKAIYPGTFDPITIGHLDIIKRAAKIFDDLTIAIAENPSKKPLFSHTERKDLVINSIKEYPEIDHKKINIVKFSGLLVNFAAQNNISVLIRGLRAISDFEYEFQMSCMNNKLNSNIQTIFLPASDQVQFISSRFVKQIASLNGDIKSLVSKAVAEVIYQKIAEN